MTGMFIGEEENKYERACSLTSDIKSLVLKSCSTRVCTSIQLLRNETILIDFFSPAAL